MNKDENKEYSTKGTIWIEKIDKGYSTNWKIWLQKINKRY